MPDIPAKALLTLYDKNAYYYSHSIGLELKYLNTESTKPAVTRLMV